MLFSDLFSAPCRCFFTENKTGAFLRLFYCYLIYLNFFLSLIVNEFKLIPAKTKAAKLRIFSSVCDNSAPDLLPAKGYLFCAELISETVVIRLGAGLFSEVISSVGADLFSETTDITFFSELFSVL